MIYEVFLRFGLLEIVTRHVTIQEALARARMNAGSLISGPDGAKLPPWEHLARMGIVERL